MGILRYVREKVCVRRGRGSMLGTGMYAGFVLGGGFERGKVGVVDGDGCVCLLSKGT